MPIFMQVRPKEPEIPKIPQELPSEEEIIANKIIKKLAGLGISGIKIESALKGPVVTGFPIKLHASTSISKIVNKEEEIALTLGVESVDIRRVLGEIVVFVPNKNRKIVDFKDSLFWFLKDETVKSMKLPILLGTDFEGHNSVIDLVDQPHVLIAGSTGSGKSIFESSIIASIAMAKTEKELEIYLVDTKLVDLTLFSNLEHVREVAKTADDWYLVVNSLHAEVQRRNKAFARSGVRNISEWNAKEDKKLPYILLIIDELADLLDKDKEAREIFVSQGNKAKEYPEPKVIESLRRLIQICRASGVHVIACTQRTSVDIVNGTVKANFPTRISLRLPSGIDSRVILGQNGAENLLGKGDMLIQRSESDVLERFHASFVKLSDIEMIISQKDMIKEQLGL